MHKKFRSRYKVATGPSPMTATQGGKCEGWEDGDAVALLVHPAADRGSEIFKRGK